MQVGSGRIFSGFKGEGGGFAAVVIGGGKVGGGDFFICVEFHLQVVQNLRILFVSLFIDPEVVIVAQVDEVEDLVGGIFLGISPDFIALSDRAGGDALDFNSVVRGGLTVSQQVFVGNAEVVHGGDFCLQVLAHGDFIIRIVGGMQHAISVAKFQTASSCSKGDGVHQQDGSVIHKVFLCVDVNVCLDGEGFADSVHGVGFAVFLAPLHFAQDGMIGVEEFPVSCTVPGPEFRIENIGVRGVCLFISLCADRIEGEIFFAERFFGGVQEAAVGLLD